MRVSTEFQKKKKTSTICYWLSLQSELSSGRTLFSANPAKKSWKQTSCHCSIASRKGTTEKSDKENSREIEGETRNKDKVKNRKKKRKKKQLENWCCEKFSKTSFSFLLICPSFVSCERGKEGGKVYLKWFGVSTSKCRIASAHYRLGLLSFSFFFFLLFQKTLYAEKGKRSVLATRRREKGEGKKKKERAVKNKEKKKTNGSQAGNVIRLKRKKKNKQINK